MFLQADKNLINIGKIVKRLIQLIHIILCLKKKKKKKQVTNKILSFLTKRNKKRESFAHKLKNMFGFNGTHMASQ